MKSCIDCTESCIDCELLSNMAMGDIQTRRLKFAIHALKWIVRNKDAHPANVQGVAQEALDEIKNKR